MRRITQRHEIGCGIACVAMLAGVGYSEAQSAIFGNQPVGLTSTAELAKALRKLGKRPAGNRLIPLRTHSYRDLKANALLKVPRPNKDWFHWIVWDAGRQVLLDPQTPAVRRPRVTSYLIVE